MEELNNLENINFSGSPEYIDVFNNGISTLSEEYGTSPTAGVNCDNQVNGTFEITCAPSNGNPVYTEDEICIVGKEDCAGNETCVAALEDPAPPLPTTKYQVRFTFGIKVKSHLLNGKNGYIGNDTWNGWGHSLKLKYATTSNYFFTSGTTYDFTYTPALTGPCYTIIQSRTNISSSSDLNSFISTITGTSHTFIVVSIDGHDIPNNKKITCTVKYKSGNANSNIEAPEFTSTDTVNTLSLSAKTYNISYDINSTPTDSDFEKILKTSIKIGTKFSVYSDSSKTKRATTINDNSYYTYSVGYHTSATTYSFKPWHRFFINTSAETIYVKQERCGESYETTVNLNYSGIVPVLPPMQTSGKLATLKTLYDSSSGLGITSFKKMFSNEISSKENMVLTPNNYEKLYLTDEVIGTTHFSYTRPKMYYSASTTNTTNYCLKINDISTFDKNIYLVSTGYTNPAGGVILTPNIVHNSFQTYKNYPLTNVKNGSDWTAFESEKKYFTFYL